MRGAIGLKNIFRKLMKVPSYVIHETIRKRYVLSEEDIFSKQEQLLRNMLQYAKKHCDYYKDIVSAGSSLRITDFPVVDRHVITSNFDRFCSNQLEYYIHGDAYTGGSTGEPFHLLTSLSYETEFGRKRWKRYGYKKGNVILALDGTKIPEEKLRQGIYWQAKNKEDIPFGSLALSSLYLSDENAPVYCNYIKSVKPDFLRGYPSFIYSIAQYAKQLLIDMSGFVKGIELTSEVVTDDQINMISQVFGAPVFLQYGHTEACICAYTDNDLYKYKVEPLYGYVEILNTEDQHVKEGEVGEVVVTSLHNFALPLIRYRTGDFAEYGGKDDRYVYLNKVMGRTQDYIVDRNNNRILLTAMIFGQHFKAMGNIVKWQIEQFVPGSVILHVVRNHEFTIHDEAELTELFETLGNVSVTFDYCNSIPVTPRGKSKMLVQHIS